MKKNKISTEHYFNGVFYYDVFCWLRALNISKSPLNTFNELINGKRRVDGYNSFDMYQNQILHFYYLTFEAKLNTLVPKRKKSKKSLRNIFKSINNDLKSDFFSYIKKHYTPDQYLKNDFSINDFENYLSKYTLNFFNKGRDGNYNEDGILNYKLLDVIIKYNKKHKNSESKDDEALLFYYAFKIIRDIVIELVDENFINSIKEKNINHIINSTFYYSLEKFFKCIIASETGEDFFSIPAHHIGNTYNAISKNTRDNYVRYLEENLKIFEISHLLNFRKKLIKEQNLTSIFDYQSIAIIKQRIKTLHYYYNIYKKINFRENIENAYFLKNNMYVNNRQVYKNKRHTQPYLSDTKLEIEILKLTLEYLNKKAIY